MISDDVRRVRNMLAGAKRVAVLAGAGVSAESGVPTFRGEEGLWRNFDPMQLATPEAFSRDPKLVWEWYGWRRSIVAKCGPNPAHYALAKLESRIPEFLLITQNVDGLHERAGSKNIAFMHGSIWRVKRIDGKGEVREDRRVPISPIPPRDSDGTLLRPAVVWFGETIPIEPMKQARNFFSEGPDVVLIVGTTGMITYIQYWLMSLKEAGVPLVEINLEKTIVSEIADVSLYGKAGEILPQLL